MSDKFVRRPFAMGNTDAPVLTQPALRGSVQKNSSNEFAALPLPSEIAVETEDPATSGGISAVFTTLRTAAGVVAAFNTALAGYAEAEEFEGCLLISSVGTGEGAYIRVLPPISGFDDASAAFGFSLHPHPLATVFAGDLSDAPVRPRQQDNPVGTKYLAVGEDRVGSAFNRALNLLGGNGDTLYTWLRQPVARAAVVTVDSTVNAAQITTNADGSVAQVNLTDLSVFDAALAGKRLYVGGLTKNSTLNAISRSFAVQDVYGKQLLAGDATVRVGAVTRGLRAAVMPAFASETAAPTGTLSDTTGVAVDGGNALGVNRTKQASTAISEVRQRTTVVCPAATFVTKNVRAGDVATISGAAIDTPFNHDGDYLVDVVVSETELVLRPHEDSGHVRELNPTAGTFGNLTVKSGGKWEEDLFVSFYPPVARFPTGGKISLVLPVEEALGDLSLGHLLDGDVRSSADVAGWTILQLWRNLTLDGVYQGAAAARGSGFHANVTHRPLRLDAQRTTSVGAGTSSRVSTGNATLDAHTLRLTAAAADRFDLTDVGKTILLTAGATFLTKEPWTIVRLIDESTVELVPPLHRAGYQEPAATTVTVTAWDIRDGDAIDVYGLVHVVSPEFFGEADSAPAAGGFIYSREQRDTAAVTPPVPGLFSFLHLERIRLNRAGVNISVTTVATTAASNVLLLSFDPEATSNIFGETYETRTGTFQSGITYVRVLNGPNTGLYRVKGLKSVTISANAVTVQHLDGTPVVFTLSAVACQVAFYNATIAGSVPILGGPGAASSVLAALSLFQDGAERGDAYSALLRLNWVGPGAGIYGYVNDPEFKAYDGGDGADGPAVQLVLFAPAEGLDIQMVGADTGADNRRAGFAFRMRAHTNRHDFALSAPVTGGAQFQLDAGKGYAGYIGQTGKDPALIVMKQENVAVAGESTKYSGLSPSATLGVGRAGPASASDLIGPSGRGSALELAGSLWVYKHTEGSGSRPAWSEGGVFVEDSVGAGRWLYSMVGVYDFESSPYYGTGSFTGWESPTLLGNPGQVYPTTPGGSQPSADFLAPDYTLFNFRHTGIVKIDDVTALPEPFVAPFNRLVGCRVRVTEVGATYVDDEFAVIGIVMPVLNTLYLALYSEATTITTSDLARTFIVLGQRWHEAHLSVGDFLMVGTSRERGTLEQAPVVTTLTDELATEIARAPLAAVSSGDLQTVVALGPYLWAGTDGSRIGLGGALVALPNVDVTAGAYVPTWPNGGYEFIEHGWSVDSIEPRGPFPNFASIAMSDVNSPEDPYIGSAYGGSMLVNDLVATLGTSFQLKWSEKWGGCIHANRTAGGSTTARIWRPGHTLVLAGHLAVKVTVILQVQDNKSVTLALRKADGSVLDSEVIAVTLSTTPQEISAELRVLTAAVYQEGAIGAVAQDISAVAVFCTMDVGLQNVGDDVYILEYRAEPLTKPTLVDGPLVVAGPVLAHGFRFADPVKGFDTRGPLDAEMLCGPHFGYASGDLNDILRLYPSAALLARIGVQELDGMPGRIRANPGAGAVWYQMVAPKDTFFAKGPHAAAVTLVSGVYDPVYYIYATRTLADDTSDVIHTENFQLPGRTGFVVPFDPPHGALLTSLALSMSFRPSYRTGTTDLHWGIFRAFDVEDAAPAGGEPGVNGLLSQTKWEGTAGVYVELWRHNCVDMGIDETLNAEFDSSVSLPPYGFSERLLQFIVDLSAVTPPSYAANLVDQATSLPGIAEDVYAGTEHFERRSWDLLQKVAAADQHVLRVDRRQYTYFMVISFWGGPRDIVTRDGDAIFAYSAEYTRAFESLPTLNTGTPPLGSPLNEPSVRISTAYPGEDVGTANISFPPQVKFRGARLGWITDRGGNGGWGT